MKTRIADALEDLLADIYEEKGIENGDIDPFQSLKFEEIIEQIETLFNELINQNE
jgi:hypothetical protein